MRIAVDAMGGDYAPQAIVEGILLAAQEYSDVEFILYGDGEKIKPYLGDHYNTDKINLNGDGTFVVINKVSGLGVKIGRAHV